DLAAQREGTQKQSEDFQQMVAFLSQSRGMLQLTTMFSSFTTELRSTSKTASASRDPSESGNADPSSSGNPDGCGEDYGGDGDVKDLYAWH
nr:hypothetical protein [Tanacetum cinerariifolium]